MPLSAVAPAPQHEREIIRDGQHTTEALSALANEISDPASLHVIAERAASILRYAVDPISGDAEPSYGHLFRSDSHGQAMDAIAETIDSPVRLAPPANAHRKWSDFVP
jgi:hypothetical protein